MDKRPYDLWAEVPSPIKTRLRNAFTAYAEECFQKDGILLKTYVPAQVGGNMPKEEYLKGMKPEDLPDACFLMDFGECSEATFAALAEKAYEKPEIRAWFPEVMAVDIRRLGERKIPETYDDLLREEYRGEICLIGNKKMPDPLAGLYMLRKYGPEGLEAFVRNVASFAPPSETPFFSCRPCLPRSAWKNRRQRLSSPEAEPSPNPCSSTRNPSLRPKKKSAASSILPPSASSWQTTRCPPSEITDSGLRKAVGSWRRKKNLKSYFMLFIKSEELLLIVR